MWVNVICLIREVTSNWNSASWNHTVMIVVPAQMLKCSDEQLHSHLSLTSPSDQRAKQTGGSEKETGAGGGADEEDGGG